MSFYWCLVCHACHTLRTQTLVFPNPPSLNLFLQLVTAFTSLSSACSVSCCVAYFLLSMLPHIILFPCPLMSHPLVCSHNLSPAPTASRSGTWITILVHLAAGDNCCLCSDAELFFALISQRVHQDRSPREGLF